MAKRLIGGRMRVEPLCTYRKPRFETHTHTVWIGQRLEPLRYGQHEEGMQVGSRAIDPLPTPPRPLHSQARHTAFCCALPSAG